MTNEKLQELLKKYPNNWNVFVCDHSGTIFVDPIIANSCIDSNGLPSDGNTNAILLIANDKNVENPEQSSFDSEKQYDIKDLAGQICYLGSFSDWGNWADYSLNHKLESKVGYVFRVAKTNQFFGIHKNGSWVNVTDSIQSIVTNEFKDKS